MSLFFPRHLSPGILRDPFHDPTYDATPPQALHIASIRGHLGAAEALVAAGAKVEQKNGRGWTALDEAISLRDRQMVAVLYRHRMGELKSVYKAKKAEFIENLDGMADFKLQVLLTNVCEAPLSNSRVGSLWGVYFHHFHVSSNDDER